MNNHYQLHKRLNQIFEEVWAKTEDEIKWNHYWGNQKGLFRGMFTHPAYEVRTPKNSVLRMTDGYGRRCLVVGTQCGSIVVYRAEVGKNSDIRVMSHPDVVDYGLYQEDNISEADIRCILGYDDALYSISQLIDQM